MDLEEALLTLAAGDPADRPQAEEWLFDEYYEKLVAALVHRLGIDEENAASGAAQALMDFYEKASTVVPKLEGQSGQPWGWLLLAAKYRAIDEQRRTNSQLQGALTGAVGSEPEEEQPDISVLPHREDTMSLVLTNDRREVLREFFFTLLPTLDEIDRHVLLHDLVARYDLLGQDEAQAFDDEFLARGNLEGIYTKEQLKKRRQRLQPRIRQLLEKKVI